MANLIARGSNNFSSSNSWYSAETLSASIAGATASTVPTSAGASSDSAAFTPGVITTDGIVINIASISATPTGTLTVTLRNATSSTDVASVTVNISDLHALTSNTAPGSWHFFKFSSPQTLLGVTNYKVRLVSSNSNQVICYGGASNDWNRLLRTNTAATPAATDRLFIQGEYTGAGTSNALTITNDINSTTSYGEIDISDRATMSDQVASTSSLRVGGMFYVWPGGTHNRQPNSGVSSTLEMDCASAVQFGYVCYGTATWAGTNKSKSWSLLNADASAGATSLTITDSVGTNWLSGDTLVITSTTRTVGDLETKTTTGAGSGTSIPVNALTNAHGGNNSTSVQAEIGNLTRSVLFQTVTAANPTYIFIGTVAVVSITWSQILNIGSATANKRGIDVQVTTGSCTIQNCAIWNSTTAASSRGVYISGASSNNITIDNNVIYNLSGTCITIDATSGASNLITNNLLATSVSNAVGAQLNDVGVTFSGNYISSINQNAAGAVQFNEAGAIGTIANNVVHSNVSSGWLFLAQPTAGAISGTLSWRNGTGGFRIAPTSSNISGSPACTVSGGKVFGNATAGLTFGGIGAFGDWTFDSIAFDGGTTLTQPVGVELGNNTGVAENMQFFSCTFGANQTHSTADINQPICCKVKLYNCSLASTTEVGTQSGMTKASFIQSSRHDQSAGGRKTWYRYGTIQDDTSVFNTASPSTKMTPNNANFKLSLLIGKVNIKNGQAATISAIIRKSATYNGAQPRLIVGRNDSGVSSDTVLATYSAGTGSFNTISGTTSAATEDITMDFYVDCDGTAGNINIDDLSVTVA